MEVEVKGGAEVLGKYGLCGKSKSRENERLEQWYLVKVEFG